MMNKWEYCSLDWYNGRGYVLTFFKSNGAVSTDLKKDKLKGDKNDWESGHRTIAELGLDGWELVSHDQEVGRSSLYFKRPLP
jgi:hypothetical protein